MFTDITGVVLAGGQSLRMGENKALLKLGNKTIIERIVELMREIFSDVMLISNSPSEYEYLCLKIYEDIYKYKGPLAGIHSGLVHSQTKIFIVSCDVPLVNKQMIEYLVRYQTPEQIIVYFAAGFLQPLVGIYSKSLIPVIEILLESATPSESANHKHGSIYSLLEKVKTKIIKAESLPFYNDDLFMNINDKDDYLNLLKKFKN